MINVASGKLRMAILTLTRSTRARFIALGLPVMIAFSGTSPALADGDMQPQEQTPKNQTLSHTHAGSETKPLQDAVLVDVAYVFDVWTSVSGGIDEGTRYIDNLDLVVEADMERLVGWNGATVLVYGLYNNGNSFSELAGDAQVVSNIETGVEALRLYEFWINQQIGDRASIKVGLYDLNSEFDVLESSGLFVGSAHGIGTDIAQSGENGPSIFPLTSLAARLEVEVANGFKVRAAVLDGVPGDPDRPKRTAVKLGDNDGALLIAEGELTSGSSKLLFGHWRYTEEFETWSGLMDDGNAGWYLRGETRLLSESGDSAQGLDVFARLGIAEGRINPFGSFVSGGLTYTGPFAGRVEDQLGIAFATAVVSDDFKAATPSLDHETAFELTYRAPITPWLTLQPGLHYVVNPSAAPGVADAVAVTLRTEVSL